MKMLPSGGAVDLFTGVRGIRILRTSPLGNSPKFAPEIATWLTRLVHMVDAPNTGLLLPFITLVRERSTGMSTEENKNLARRSWEIVNQRNPDLIEEFYPPEFVWHEPDRDVQGYEQAKQFVSSFFEA